MRQRFVKMHGLGNDFVVIDAAESGCVPEPTLVRRLADRHTGIGCDQLLVLEPPRSPGSAAAYRVFNADGAEVEQCGNGARCLGLLVAQRDARRGELTLDGPAGPVAVRVDAPGAVSVRIAVPDFEPAAIPLVADGAAPAYTLTLDDGEQVAFGAVSLGNPHAVLEMDPQRAPVARLGAAIAGHARFPAGANVGFAARTDRSHLRLRVFERGVGETRACGTGACAAAVVLSNRGLLDEEVAVDLPGGRLMVSWAGQGRPVWLTGPAERVFEGYIDT